MITVNTLGGMLLSRYKGEKVKMSDNLYRLAAGKAFTVALRPVTVLKKPKSVEIPPPEKPRQPSKIIIGDVTSKGPFVREQVIRLKPGTGERGTGEGSKAGAGATVGSRTSQKGKKSRSGIGEMGGRHTSSTRR